MQQRAERDAGDQGDEQLVMKLHGIAAMIHPAVIDLRPARDHNATSSSGRWLSVREVGMKLRFITSGAIAFGALALGTRAGAERAGAVRRQRQGRRADPRFHDHQSRHGRTHRRDLRAPGGGRRGRDQRHGARQRRQPCLHGPHGRAGLSEHRDGGDEGAHGAPRPRAEQDPDEPGDPGPEPGIPADPAGVLHQFGRPAHHRQQPDDRRRRGWRLCAARAGLERRDLRAQGAGAR